MKKRLVKIAVVFILLLSTSYVGKSSLVVTFCTHEWQPYWGICLPKSDGSGFNCEKIAPGCSLCDCDGTFEMEFQ